MLNIRTATELDRMYLIHSHADIYSKERAFDESFRAFIKTSVDEFFSESTCGEIWMLEKEGKPFGSIAVHVQNKSVAQLRLFLIEPSVRGLGGAQLLMDQAINYATEQGVDEIILWTSTKQAAARNIYGNYGFVLTESKTSYLSNQYLIEEKWTRMLKTEVTR